MSAFQSCLRVLTTAAVLACVLPACTATGSPPEPNWQPCQEDSAFDCATIPVPIDWSNRGDAHIDISLILDRADDPAHRIGTLVSLPGGPGTSGVDEILKGGKFSPELHARFDIVSLDPRGVKRSNAIRCDSGLAMARPGLVPDASGGSITEVHSYARDLADSCREHTGPLFDHVDAASTARDVEALREALGEHQLTLYSRSYGTMAAQAYAELFPQRLRASLLDSVDDHSLSGREFVASSARAGEDTFTEFADWCARDQRCALHGTDVAAVYTDLFTAATEGRLPDPKAQGEPLTPLELSQRTTAPLYIPDWPKLAADLATLTAQPLGPSTVPTRPARSGEPVDYPAVAVCADWDFALADHAEWLREWRVQNANAPTLRAHFAWAAGSICSGWPNEPANPPHLPRDTGAPPVLILNSRHDPATPHEWATGVAATTPRATLLTYEGWGHGIYDRTGCTSAAADRYLLDLELPAVDRCPAA